MAGLTKEYSTKNSAFHYHNTELFRTHCFADESKLTSIDDISLLAEPPKASNNIQNIVYEANQYHLSKNSDSRVITENTTNFCFVPGK